MSFGNISPFSGIDASMALNNVASMGPASALTNGYLTAVDWAIFNAKEPAITKLSAFNKAFGTIADTVAQGNDSRIINGETAYGWGNHAGLYSLLAHNHSLDALTNVTVSANSDGEILRWTGGTWANNTLIEAGIIKVDQTIGQTIGLTGTRLTKLWASDIDSTSITASTITSTVTTGTAPFTVASTTVVTNLNADLFDGHDSSYFLGSGSALLLDQTTPQSVTNGSPIFEGIQFDITPSTTNIAEGLLRWNSTDGTLDLGMSGGDITMQLGQELFTKVRNAAGYETISNGQVVYVSGRTGAYSDVRKARSDSESTARVRGVATQDIASPGFGFITTFGYVRGIKTDYTGNGDWGTTWVTNDLLYVSKTVAGQLTNIEPAAPNYADTVATVGIVHATQGTIEISINRHKTLAALSDINGTALTVTGQFPVWDQVGGYFDFNYNITNYQSASSNLTSISSLTYASTSFVKMTGANTFGLDTNVYIIKSGDTGLGNMYFANNSIIDVVSTVGSDVLNIGTTNADIINIGYASSTVNINGVVSYQYATDLKVVDKLITLNVNGGVASGVSSGFEIEENNVITGWLTTSGARTGFELRAPATSYSAIFLLSSLAAERTYTFPNASGTVALTSNLHDAITLATDSGLALSTQVLNMGTPSTVTSSTSNAVSTNTHSHAITAGLGFIGNGSQANEILVTGATPFTPAWTLATNLVSLNALSFASTSFVKMSATGTFGLDTNTYLTSVTAHNLLSATHGDTLADTVIRGDIIIGNSTPKWARLAFPATPTGKVLIASATDIEWSPSALGTAAYTASTAYDVAGAAAAVTPTTLGLVIGTNVQAYNSNLTGINQALTTTSSPSFTAVGATTFTGALTGHASSDALVDQQFYIGTTQVAINRASAALVLTGITSIDGTAAKATNLVGGNSTTLLGSIGYQSNTDTTTMLAPNTSTTLKFLSQTGTGTNGTAPTWHQMLMTELPPLANDTWLTALNYAGGTSNLFKLSADNVLEFASAVKICAFYHVLNSGFNDIVDIPVDSTSADGTEHGVGITVGGTRIFKVGALSDGAGDVDTTTMQFLGTHLGFYGVTPVVRPTALTTQLTSITHTAPGTPDYAIQDLVDSGGFGFVTKDEGNTVLSTILNLQTRVAELQTKLTALGLLT